MRAVPTLLCFLAAACGCARAQNAPSRSPFLPPAGPGSAAHSGPAEAYELAGASSTDAGTQICLYDTATKHSRWLTVGQNDGGIEVVSYDANNDQAVVRFDGQVHLLSLRHARMGPAGGPQLVGAYPPPGTSLSANAPVVDPSTVGKSPEVVKQEREARMLVSDLLEISIKQRKAYEEAQRKAAKGP